MSCQANTYSQTGIAILGYVATFVLIRLKVVQQSFHTSGNFGRNNYEGAPGISKKESSKRLYSSIPRIYGRSYNR